LVRPIQSETTKITSSALRLSSSSSLRLSLVDDLLRPVEDESSDATAGNDLSFQLDQVPSQISILPIPTEATGRRSTVIERVWVQSLLTTTERRDRACFRLSTNESQLDFILPVGVGGKVITVLVDGQRTDRSVLTKGRELRVDLDDTFGSRELTVELWYWFTAQPAALGKLHLQAPRLAGGTHADRVYWELLLPPNEHLVWAARNLISENTWRWQGTHLARSPNRSQDELERWVQASQRTENQGFNRYVFSSVGTEGSNMVITTLRPFATFIVAGAVFAAGVLLLYVPWLRHPLLLFAAGTLLVAAAISFPETSLLAGQAIAVGLVFIIMTRLMMAMISRQPAPRLSSRSGFRSAADSRSSATGRRADSRLDIGSNAGTATLAAGPLHMTASSNEP
jgi:hypothetical protein